jgi:hypothetical protein
MAGGIGYYVGLEWKRRVSGSSSEGAMVGGTYHVGLLMSCNEGRAGWGGVVREGAISELVAML